MITPSLHLYGRPTGDEAHIRDLTPIARGWQRRTHRMYGYLAGSFGLSSAEMSKDEIIWLYHSAIGCTVREKTAGMTSWEGLVWEMKLTLGGVTYVRTLDPEWFSNKVAVAYSTATASGLMTAWSENTDSSDVYGEMQYIDTLGSSTADAATARRDRRLVEMAWPRSRMVGGVTIGQAASTVSLEVAVVGYWSTLNWRYYTADTTAAANSLVSTLVALSEFVTAGRIETNALSVRVNSATGTRQQRIGDLIADIIEQGDASGNVWQGGVYADKRLRYEAAPTTATHYLQRGRLLNAGMSEPVLSMVEPGILVKNLNAPMGYPAYGTYGAFDDPAIGYVEQVEYAAPNTLTIQFHGVETDLAVMGKQMAAGNYGPSMNRTANT